jgi:hypothetical protein
MKLPNKSVLVRNKRCALETVLFLRSVRLEQRQKSAETRFSDTCNLFVWLVTDFDLFREKNVVGWLLMTDFF